MTGVPTWPPEGAVGWDTQAGRHLAHHSMCVEVELMPSDLPSNCKEKGRRGHKVRLRDRTGEVKAALETFSSLAQRRGFDRRGHLHS